MQKMSMDRFMTFYMRPGLARLDIWSLNTNCNIDFAVVVYIHLAHESTAYLIYRTLTSDEIFVSPKRCPTKLLWKDERV